MRAENFRLVTGWPVSGVCFSEEVGSVIDVEACYRRYGPMVVRRCRALLKDEEEAHDAMQDVFVKLIRFDKQLTDDNPSSLLLRMATNECLNRIRTRRRKPTESDDDLIDRIANADDSESRYLARGMLARIFGKEQESTAVIAVMHLVDGMTLEETARQVGMSVSGVRKRLRTLSEHVRELLEA
ncbi:MAG: sigma-70 family RNA polymerase sigma factor [Myxococcales bacterium]|nr:MAG: sigma-70 family RNA polymerase sigma factor [Myxococcales bacterium]